ncbi:MAG: hypothetical protein SOH99_09585 [Acidipropionibacterium acidipropionici]|jgi:hypothetical protein|uniref:Uncharacterized protein n=2 Tax=Acidipropionibacterium acidipropionici TaxID=1748 RepID=A0A142KFH1_9ACTN|nr:hypothetical protein [Acidipropionibacterium acidipropionici]AFV90024.1 hypothetical protein PACID_22390 [Acidipropionibacterium acidipropionici ATCC 4875]ALN15652.1 hypothetical protein ASQ49_10690 [Acidipropionibacterium acidipropionici]AMS04859.1 hypothetical protein AXH35_04555 [Acidipropionibacterium acidipropionici]AOZ46343.1 hypothetical protein A8L58_06020 [Acidipropionibacterium acidipropionici]APZ08601.1 hypothetical protein BWX38_04220 [Acidipropionibacterium acidipropionici]
MGGMSAPRRAAPENEEELVADAKAWRRYSVLVIIGIVVAVLGLGVFGYLGWWSLCDSTVTGCRPGEAATYWGSTVAAAALGAIIGILSQIWLPRKAHIGLSIGLPVLVVIVAVVFWFVV